LQIGICKVAYDALRQLHKEIVESLEKQVNIDENMQETWSAKFQEITQTVT
jgi:septum formation topological specificity factor MinE